MSCMSDITVKLSIAIAAWHNLVILFLFSNSIFYLTRLKAFVFFTSLMALLRELKIVCPLKMKPVLETSSLMVALSYQGMTSVIGVSFLKPVRSCLRNFWISFSILQSLAVLPAFCGLSLQFLRLLTLPNTAKQ